MNARRWIIVGAFLVVLVSDSITKVFAPHSGWTWHDHPLQEAGRPSWSMTLFVLTTGFVCVMAFRSIGLAVALAGALGNLGWAIATGGTPNPLTDYSLSMPGESMAFNVADVAIQGGALFGCLEISIVVAVWFQGWVSTHRARRAILPPP